MSDIDAAMQKASESVIKRRLAILAEWYTPPGHLDTDNDKVMEGLVRFYLDVLRRHSPRSLDKAFDEVLGQLRGWTWPQPYLIDTAATRITNTDAG